MIISSFSRFQLFIKQKVCLNHRLFKTIECYKFLKFEYLIPKYSSLAELHGLLILLWKTFKLGTIKKTIFENAELEHDMKPLKIMQAVLTRWPINGESCAWVVSRFKSLNNALGVI